MEATIYIYICIYVQIYVYVYMVVSQNNGTPLQTPRMLESFYGSTKMSPPPFWETCRCPHKNTIFFNKTSIIFEHLSCGREGQFERRSSLSRPV